MEAIVVALLGVLPQALADVPAFESAIANIKGALSSPTAAALQAIISSQQAATQKDVAQLAADAAAAAQ